MNITDLLFINFIVNDLLLIYNSNYLVNDLYSRTARLLLIHSLLIIWTEIHKQYSVIQSS